MNPDTSGPTTGAAPRTLTTLQQSLLRRVLLIGLLPLLVLLAALTLGTWRYLEATAQARTTSLARAHARTLELLLTDWRAQAVAVATSSHVNAPAGTDGTELRSLTAAGQPFEAAYLSDSAGRLLRSAQRGGDGVAERDLLGLDLSANDWYREAVSSGGVVWTQTYQSLLTRYITAAIVVPRAGGGVLVAELSLPALARAMRVEGVEELVAVIDDRGRIVGHPDAALAQRQVDMAQVPRLRQAMLGERGLGRFTWREREWIGSVRSIPSSDWSAVVAEPHDRLIRPLWTLLAVLAGTGALAAFVAVLAARRLAVAEGERHARLLDAAHRVEAGVAVTPHFQIAEFDRLWRELSQLITRLKRNEAEALEARSRVQAVFDASSEVAIIATDLQGRVTTFNRGAERMLGWPASQVLGRSDRIDWGASGGSAGEPWQLALRHGQDVRDRTMTRHDGSSFRASVATTVIRSAAQQPTGVLWVVSDLSDRERAERALAANRAKSDFLSRVSHELRTPMNAILGFAQVLTLRAHAWLDDEGRRQLARIEAAGWHLLHLIDDLLDLSRLEAGSLRLQRAVVPLRATAQQALDLLSERAQAGGVNLQLEAVDGEVCAWADSARLRQVFINLVSNAVKYTRPGGSCVVRVGPQAGEMVHCEVRDDGIGMTPEQLGRLFEPFNRLGRETLDSDGHGIGLVIVRDLVAAMGGRVTVQSLPERGTTVQFTLQAATARDAAGEKPAQVLQAGLPAAVDDAVDVVLLEDNDVNVILVESVLSMRPRCRLHVASRGEQALELILRIRPRLVLLDINVPDLSGLEVLRRALADPHMPQAIYVMLSADTAEESVSQALSAGAHSYLSKPINVDQLLGLFDRAVGMVDPGAGDSGRPDTPGPDTSGSATPDSLNPRDRRAGSALN